MIQERRVTVASCRIPDFHSALAWAVQTYDREFAKATMVSLTVEQTSINGPDDGDEWHYQWNASVGGLVEEINTEDVSA